MKTSHSHSDQGVGIDAKNYKSKNSEANIEYWKNVNTPPPASSDDVDAVKVSNNTNIKSSPQSSLNINGAIKVSNNDKMNEATHEHRTNIDGIVTAQNITKTNMNSSPKSSLHINGANSINGTENNANSNVTSSPSSDIIGAIEGSSNDRINTNIDGIVTAQNITKTNMNSSPKSSLHINGANSINGTENNANSNVTSSPSSDIIGAIEGSSNDRINTKTQQHKTNIKNINAMEKNVNNIVDKYTNNNNTNAIIMEQLNVGQGKKKQHHYQQQAQSNQEKLAELQALAEKLGISIEPIKLSNNKPSSSSSSI